MKNKIFVTENVPTFLVMVVFICGLLLFGADSSPSSLVVSMLVCVSVLVSVIAFRDVQFSPIIGFMFLLWAGFVALSYVSERTAGVEDEYLMLLSAIGIFGLGQYAGQSSNRLQTAMKLFLILGLLFSVFAFIQHIVAPDMVLGFKKPYNITRLGGVFLSSNTAATYLGMIFLIAIPYLRRAWLTQTSVSNSSEFVLFLEVFQKTSLAMVTCLFTLVCLLLTASRSGVAGTFLAIMVFGMWITLQQLSSPREQHQTRRGFRLLVLVVVAALILYLWNLSGDLVSTRYERAFSETKSRTDILDASWRAFLQKPWFGHGLGRFDAARLLGTTPENNANVVYVHAAHNVFAQWLVQVGGVGVGVFGIVYLFILAKILQGARRARRYKTYCLAILCISLLVGLHGLFDYAMEIPIVMLTYTWLLGIAYGISIRYVRTD